LVQGYPRSLISVLYAEACMRLTISE